MARGRPRKSGKRTKSGRLISERLRDNGTDAAQMRRDIFGENGCDAIGRAYTIGALGIGDIAKDRLTIARQLFAWYWPSMNLPGYRCPLNREPVGHSEAPSVEQHREQVERERRMNAKLEAARKTGHQGYHAFDQLVIDVNPDSGPAWLDLLVMEWAFSKTLPVAKADWSTALWNAHKQLGMAVKALDAAGGLSAQHLTIAA